MAKPNKTDAGKSVLRAAYERFEHGDAVQARALANEVLAGRVGKDDESAAKDLAARLSTDEAPVAPTPEAVARELVSRSGVPRGPYLYLGAIATAFVVLVTLASLRY